MADLYKVQVGDLLRLTTYIVSQEQTGENVFFFRVKSTTAGSINLRDVADAFNTQVASRYTPMLKTTAHFKGTKAEAFNVLPEPAYAYVADDEIGTVDDVELPRQTCGLIHWETGLASRSKRGRTYVPFPTQLHNEDPGQPQAVYITLLNDLATYLSGVIALPGAIAGSATLGLEIWSPKLNVGEPVIQFVSRNRWATQRRRGSYGKANTPPG